MFVSNEEVVYPGHGVAIIEKIVERNLAGKKPLFFQLKFISKDMTILVPVENAQAVGIRKLSTTKFVQEIFDMLQNPLEIKPRDIAVTNWNKRHKEYQSRLMSGNLKDICQIYRELKAIESQKELSFGEKGLLQQTEQLLVEELAQVHNITQKDMVQKVRDLISVPISSSTAKVTLKQL